MTSNEIRQRFLNFFAKRGHAVLPSASLVPENDPTVLFNTAGMQPLVPYLLGQKHPQGNRLVDAQKCIRTGDIDDVGDNRHLTFFEMLGNWSLGDYFKKEAINWSYEFLTSKEEGLGLDPSRLYVTVFKGENGIPRDDESIKIWQEVFGAHDLSHEVAGEDEFVNKNIRVIPLGTDDNFWIAGAVGPCGGDTEIFYDTRPEDGELSGKFGDLVDSFRLIEIWNNVFMEFNKTAEGKYEKLVSQNVDTGMGLERTTAVINGKNTVFETDLFIPILNKIDEFAVSSDDQSKRAKFIVADHIKAAVFMIADGVIPANTDQGYVLRRLLRRAVRFGDQLKLTPGALSSIADVVIEMYEESYPNLKSQDEYIKKEIKKEEQKFWETLSDGFQEYHKLLLKNQNIFDGEIAYTLFTSYGFPFEVALDIVKEEGVKISEDTSDVFSALMKKHQDLSRAGAEKKFKGGLADTSEMSVRYHTATHLLNEALHRVLGEHVTQKGSNITPERMRFDFAHSQKMTDEEKKKAEDLVNEKIAEGLEVSFAELPKEEALKTNARHNFGEKYGDIVKVYTIKNKDGEIFSQEFCGGPHVQNTSELGKFKIVKEEAVSAGVRRIKAVLE
ncbi:MAG: alanine--tRNA ligase [bacterium]